MEKPKRKFLRSEEMYPIIKEYLASGLSQKKFGEEHNIPLHLMTYWVRKYKESKLPKENPASKFVSLELGAERGVFGMEIEFRNGTLLKLGKEIDWPILDKILSKLNDAPTH